MAALNFRGCDKLPKDLGGMASTGISAFAYPHLVAALGLSPRRPRVYDIIQMLALPDTDVLDKLDCDVVTINNGVSGAIDEPQKWYDYDFGGRLDAQVRNPDDFTEVAAGLFHKPSNSTMIAGSYVFDEEHGGNSFDIFGDIPKPDIEQYEEALEKAVWTDRQIEEFVNYCRLVRNSTDRATLLECPINAKFGIAGFGRIAIYPLVCLTEPDFVLKFYSMLNEYSLKLIRTLLPLVKDYVDIIKIASDDWGTQNSLIASADYKYEYKTFDKSHLTIGVRVTVLLPKSKSLIVSVYVSVR